MSIKDKLVDFLYYMTLVILGVLMAGSVVATATLMFKIHALT